MEIWHWILVLYVLPLIANIILLIHTEEKMTVGELLDSWWCYMIPLVNIVGLLVYTALTFYYKLNLKKSWEKFRNIKIK